MGMKNGVSYTTLTGAAEASASLTVQLIPDSGSRGGQFNAIINSMNSNEKFRIDWKLPGQDYVTIAHADECGHSDVVLAVPENAPLGRNKLVVETRTSDLKAVAEFDVTG
jgi:hypothetical protein